LCRLLLATSLNQRAVVCFFKAVNPSAVDSFGESVCLDVPLSRELGFVPGGDQSMRAVRTRNDRNLTAAVPLVYK